MRQIERIQELNEKIIEFKKSCDKEKKNKIANLQNILTGMSSYSPKIYSIKASFKHYFGIPIEDDKFLTFMEKGLSTLYSNADNL